MQTAMSGKGLLFFPTPYPDEILYSVLCRYWIRAGRPSPRSIMEDFYGARRDSNILTPRYLGRIASLLPASSGMSVEFFLKNATIFPYFQPFLTQKRAVAYLEYLSNSLPDNKFLYFSLGMGKLRYPRTNYLRFCSECWKEDVKIHGEPYWHRLHQLPGVMVCPVHRKPLMETAITMCAAGKSFYPAEERLIGQSQAWGVYSDEMMEKLSLITSDSAWLLQNGMNCGSYEQTRAKYAQYARSQGFDSLTGHIRAKKLRSAVQNHFGDELLNLLDASCENIGESWIERIFHSPQSFQHPVYHILLTELMVGSTLAFFQEECPEFLPFGPSPWPCFNPVCPGYRRDVIERYDANPYSSCMHAKFECPICGMTYRRKRAMNKEEQYARRPKIVDYGPLWKDKLRECIVERRLSPRETCEIMGCDFYTVNRYAVRFGFLKAENAYFINWKAQPSSSKARPAMSDTEAREHYRRQWLKLMEQRPNAIRSELIRMAPSCYIWLRKNDLEWYNLHSPPARYVNFDWAEKDRQTLERIRTAYERLSGGDGKPRRITKTALINESAAHSLSSEDALNKMPETSSFLNAVLESQESWHKRKIIWAVHELSENEQRPTPNRVMLKACISTKYLAELMPFIMEQLSKLLSES